MSFRRSYTITQIKGERNRRKAKYPLHVFYKSMYESVWSSDIEVNAVWEILKHQWVATLLESIKKTKTVTYFNNKNLAR